MHAKALENHLKQTGRCCPLVHLADDNNLARELFVMSISERLNPLLDGYRVLIQESGTVYRLKMLRSWRRVIWLMQQKQVVDLMSPSHEETGGRGSNTRTPVPTGGNGPPPPPNMRDPNLVRPTGPDRPMSLNIRAKGDDRR